MTRKYSPTGSLSPVTNTTMQQTSMGAVINCRQRATESNTFEISAQV